MTKTTDINGDFKPPEENPKRRLTTKTPDPDNIYKKPDAPAIKVVPVKPTVEEYNIGEKINLNERRKSVWSKYDVGALDVALGQLGIPKVITVKIKGEFVKKHVDKINKTTMLNMIYEKLGILPRSKNYSKNT